MTLRTVLTVFPGTHYPIGGQVEPSGLLFTQPAMPAEEPVAVGTLWVDTTANLLKRCTSIAPYTFVSTEGGGGAPADAEYVVGALSGGLSAERLVTDTPTGAWDLATAGQAKVNVPDNAITDAKLRDSAGQSVIGKTGAGAGDPADIVAAADDRILLRSGGVVSFTRAALAALVDIATARLLGRTTAGAGVIEELTTAQATAMLDLFTAVLKGLVPASGGGAVNFLRADGTWAAPGGGGSPGGASGDVQFNNGAGGFGGEAAFNYDSALNLLLLDILDQPDLATPGVAAANRLRMYSLREGVLQRRTRDEYGLVDVLGQRAGMRQRRPFWVGAGSDTTGASEWNWMGMQVSTSEGTLTVQAGDATSSAKRRMTTAATLDTDAGFLTPAFTRLIHDPDVTIRFQVNSSAVRRVWIGWTEADLMAADTSPTTHKFALRLSTSPAVTGFTIVHSNGTTETVEAQIQASDTNMHTLRLIADTANARFGYSFDGATIVWITTNIPSDTQDLLFQCEIRTLEAVAKNMDLMFVQGTVAQ